MIPGEIASPFQQGEEYAFLAGAGISMDPPSNLPSAREIVRAIVETWGPEEERENLLGIENLRYEAIMETVQRLVDKNLVFLDYFERVTEPNDIHLFLAEAVAKCHPVITTNFDYLIEFALKRTRGADWDKLDFLLSKEDYAAYTRQLDSGVTRDGRPRYCKVHGSRKNMFTGLETPETLVTTLASLGRDRQGDTFAIEPFKKPAFIDMVKGRTLVVLGYSGSDDFDIGPLLGELTSLKKLVWVEHAPDASEPDITRVEPGKDRAGAGKPITLLAAIAAKASTPVYLVKVSTAAFTRSFLFPAVIGKMPQPSKQTHGEVRDRASNLRLFEQHVKDFYKGFPRIGQYAIATDVYRAAARYDDVIRVTAAGIRACSQARRDGSFPERESLDFESYFLTIKGIACRVRGELEEAMNCYSAALDIARRVGSKSSQANLQNNISMVMLSRGDLPGAKRVLEELLAMATGSRIDDLVGNVANNLGKLSEEQGKHDDAIKYYNIALDACSRTGDLALKAVITNNMGLVHEDRGNKNEAMQAYKDALRINEQLGDKRAVGKRLNNIGSILSNSGNPAASLEYFERALSIDKEGRDAVGECITINNMGVAMFSLKRYHEALTLFTRSIELAERLNETKLVLARKANIAAIYLTQGKIDLAIDTYKETLAANRKIGNVKGMASDLSNLVFLLTKAKRYGELLPLALEAATMYKDMGNRASQSNMLGYAGEALGATRKLADAERVFNDAMKIKHEIKDWAGLVELLPKFAVIYIFAGDLGSAIAACEEALDIATHLGLTDKVTDLNASLKALRARMDAQVHQGRASTDVEKTPPKF
ncbi:MAG: tetratricopeptide repeat protein [Candidatus Lokiarchaeota archaeon]|nr:tetratricopeptide repeat protein [Candidatus Lokiarchaeota archaeon]